MRKKVCSFALLCAFLLCFQVPCHAADLYRVRMFFGLSLPQGGAVSLNEWQQFQNTELARIFEGFNVVDSVGYYQGSPERSKIVTLIVEEKDIAKAKAVAQSYAKEFHQDSVMVVTIPIAECAFVSSGGKGKK